MKYPKKYEGEKTELKFPVLVDRKWFVSKLFKDGTTKKTGIAYYDKEDHCWRPCLAHNKRVGYTKKEVKKLIKKYYGEEKKETKKRKKKKNKS